MSDVVLVALIGAMPATVGVLVSVVMNAVSNSKLNAIHVQINSRMDELLKVTAKEAEAAGRAVGIEAERKRT